MYEELTDRQQRERRGEKKSLEEKEVGNSRIKRALALIPSHDDHDVAVRPIEPACHFFISFFFPLSLSLSLSVSISSLR